MAEMNEHGTPVSSFVCETCGQPFTVCPEVPAERFDEWRNCMSEDCDSYEPTRDADLYFELGMVESSETSTSDEVHVVPRNDTIDHLVSGECLCGPSTQALQRDDGSYGWVVTHHSLDGRETGGSES